jgi:hypothetical protein
VVSAEITLCPHVILPLKDLWVVMMHWQWGSFAAAATVAIWNTVHMYLLVFFSQVSRFFITSFSVLWYRERDFLLFGGPFIYAQSVTDQAAYHPVCQRVDSRSFCGGISVTNFTSRYLVNATRSSKIVPGGHFTMACWNVLLYIIEGF